MIGQSIREATNSEDADNIGSNSETSTEPDYDLEDEVRDTVNEELKTHDSELDSDYEEILEWAEKVGLYDGHYDEMPETGPSHGKRDNEPDAVRKSHPFDCDRILISCLNVLH